MVPRPRDLRQWLDERYPASASYALPEKPVWFTEEFRSLWDDNLATARHQYAGLHMAVLAEFDREHVHVHAGREVPGDVCVYAAVAEGRYQPDRYLELAHLDKVMA
jgi:hypothetical protein